MIAIDIKNAESVIKLSKKELAKHELDLEADLEELLTDTVIITKAWQRVYIKKIIENKNEIICCSPDRISQLKSEFSDIYDYRGIRKKMYKPFRDKLIETMGYKKRRSDFYPKYFQKLGVKACVYCNSQLAISVNSYEYKANGNIKRETVKAKFQVDHYLAKSDYPCFSVSLFNLYPVCASCNNCKSTISVDFNLYSKNLNETKNSFYSFELGSGCVAKYLQLYKTDAEKAKEKIEIKFTDPKKGNSTGLVRGSFQDTFDIAGIYETQKDLVEELILKSRVYKLAYRKGLVKSFHKLFTDASLANRILVGNYVEPENIHKRPMAKFTQDIAKQLGLL